MAYQGPRLRPMGIGDLLDEMIRLYRNNFLLLVGIAAVVLVPISVVTSGLQLSLGLGGRETPDFSTTAVVGLAGGGLVLGVISFVAQMAVNLAITWAVSEIYLGHRATIGSAYSGALQRLTAGVVLSLLMGLALVLMAITIIGIPFAVYFGICWVLAFQVLLLERQGITASLSRSRALVRGYWWRVLGIAILLGIIGWVFSFVFGLPAAIFGGISGLMRSGFTSTLVLMIGIVFGIVESVLVTPIWYCGAVLLYYDLRVRKEGFDLELMAQEMGHTPGVDPGVG